MQPIPTDIVRFLTCGACLLVMPAVLAQGPLTPPGAPAPTMKTLDQIEPRTLIRNNVDPIAPIVIAASGSYYLGEDILAIHSQHGIQITASDVTLDLNGFKIQGNVEVGSLDGVNISPGVKNVTIRNGTIKSFFGKGINAATCNKLRVEGVSLLANSGGGLHAGYNAALVLDCIAEGNLGDGFHLTENSRITGCIAKSNTGDGIQLSTANHAVNNICHSNGQNGILTLGHSNIITGNSAMGNSVNGIYCMDVNRGNRIDSNNTTYNTQIGIRVEGSDNQVTRNSSLGNSVAHYSIAPNNNAGAIVGDPSAAGPWDNFQN